MPNSTAARLCAPGGGGGMVLTDWRAESLYSCCHIELLLVTLQSGSQSHVFCFRLQFRPHTLLPRSPIYFSIFPSFTYFLCVETWNGRNELYAVVLSLPVQWRSFSVVGYWCAFLTVRVINETKLRGLRPRSIYTDRAKLVPIFADRGCHVVSVTDPYGRNLFSRPEPLLFLSSGSSILLVGRLHKFVSPLYCGKSSHVCAASILWDVFACLCRLCTVRSLRMFVLSMYCGTCTHVCAASVLWDVYTCLCLPYAVEVWASLCRTLMPKCVCAVTVPQGSLPLGSLCAVTTSYLHQSLRKPHSHEICNQRSDPRALPLWSGAVA
jgi:hypothetical protein